MSAQWHSVAMGVVAVGYKIRIGVFGWRIGAAEPREAAPVGLLTPEISFPSCYIGFIRPVQRSVMKSQDRFVQGTVREVMARLAHVPADERVRVMVGRPGLRVIARRLQATAEANGMTDEIHEDLLRSLCGSASIRTFWSALRFGRAWFSKEFLITLRRMAFPGFPRIPSQRAEA